MVFILDTNSSPSSHHTNYLLETAVPNELTSSQTTMAHIVLKARGENFKQAICCLRYQNKDLRPTHHKSVAGFKYVKRKFLTWDNNIHDKKRH